MLQFVPINVIIMLESLRCVDSVLLWYFKTSESTVGLEKGVQRFT